MFFRKPSVFDKPLKLFDVDGVALHFIASKSVTKFSIHADEGREKLLIPLKGFAKFMDLYAYEKDMIYIPKGLSVLDVELGIGSVVYVVEASASRDYGLYVKRFREARYVDVGDERSRRRRYIVIDVEDPSEKFLAGYTFCCPGCWGSYPPHRHDDKYEIFVYFDVEPGFGVQLLIDGDREEACIVRDFDVFLVTRGYHPNVSTPVKGLNYLWVMVAVKGGRDFSMYIDKKFDVVQR